jgi:perosamine synthetase
MVDLGYNYRMTDFQCALGISQLRKLQKFLDRRREIAARYDEAFANLSGINPLAVRPDVLHAYHLYVIRIDSNVLGTDRATLFTKLRKKGIGVNVHYIPVHLQPFYREKFHTSPGLCPIAETAYEQIISIPMFPGMTDEDVKKVIVEVKNNVCG